MLGGKTKKNYLHQNPNVRRRLTNTQNKQVHSASQEQSRTRIAHRQGTERFRDGSGGGGTYPLNAVLRREAAVGVPEGERGLDLPRPPDFEQDPLASSPVLYSRS